MIIGQFHAPATLPLDKNVGTHRAGGRAGLTSALGILEKKLIEARIFQSVFTEKVAEKM